MNTEQNGWSRAEQQEEKINLARNKSETLF
jgi:hypothetical protein